MRIIAGLAKGRKLLTLPGELTRPTADRVKEAIFSVLFGYVEQARVLDAFAGCAALGLEALSRGAESALFFEADAEAAAVCAKNIALTGLRGAVLRRGDCLTLLRTLPAGSEFDLIFLDPPYNTGLLPRAMQLIAEHKLLAADGIAVIETTAANSEFAPDAAWELLKSSRYGKTAVHYCRLNEQ